MSQPLQSNPSDFYPNPTPASNPNPANPPVDPYSSSANNGEVQAQYTVDPYSASAMNGQFQAQPTIQPPQLDHTTFPPAVDSLTGTPSYGNNNYSQYLKAYMIEPTKTANVAPTFRCELCNVTCNHKDIFDKHNQGKKHQRKLQIQARSTHNVPVDTSSATTITEELEKKKQTLLDNGAPVASLLFCTTCNIACGDEAVFQTHLIGKKHAKQVAKQASAAAGPASVASENATEVEPVKQAPQSAYCDLCQISCNSVEIFKIHLAGKRHLKNQEKSEKASCAVAATPTTVAPMENAEDTKVKGENLQETENKTDPKDDMKVEGENLQETENKSEVPATHEEDVKNKDPRDAPSNRCEVCNVTCTSPQLMQAHLQGKKHKKNIEKAKTESFIGPLVGPVAQIIGPNPEGVEGSVGEIQTGQTGTKRSCGSKEDVETKKQKVMRGGGAPDLVRVCTICNVVCSSPSVFISHLAGKKHLAVAKKATEAGIPSVTA